MFVQYYGLIEQPFGVAPDPRFLYFNRMYREALASLWYGIQESRGFMTLIAQPGTGKTTLLFQLLQRLRSSSVRTAFLFQTCCSSFEMIQYLLRDLNVAPACDLASMNQQLNDVLVSEARAGKQFVFVIDEAQNLSESVLETVRLLSDFETPQGKLLQIILAGQPQFIGTLVNPGMVQLRQRISITASLGPLSPPEVAQYISHRLATAGYRGAPLFTCGALEVIARESQGIPRNINNLCFGALSAGFALRRKQIDRQIVQGVAADQNLGAIERRVAGSQFDSVSLERKATPRISALVPAQRHESPSLAARFRRHVRQAAYAAIVLLVTMISVSLGMRPENMARFVHSQGRGMTATLQAQEISPKAATISVRVEPGDTLRQISLRHLGRYSSRIVQQIQALNPELLDPNHIEPGQQLRLPADSSLPTRSEKDPRARADRTGKANGL
jgi:general secretion pathway protein A